MADIEEKLVDRRVIERNIGKKLVSQNDFEAYLKALPDSEPNAEVVRVSTAEAAGGDERGA